MNHPQLSDHYAKREPSAVRLAALEFSKRQGQVHAINVAIGNVTLPLHPALKERLALIGSTQSPFKDGKVPYTASVGYPETIKAVKNIIAASNCHTENFHVLITDGGSQAMELAVLGTCGTINNQQRPLLLIEPAYPNYRSFAQRCNLPIVSIKRKIDETGSFILPSTAEIKKAIQESNAAALVIIPYDNPTGQFFDQNIILELATICIKENIWVISDEAYRELNYTGQEASSIWKITEETLPGITGRRISIESSSKVFNACGLRVGALVTDNHTLHEKAVAEYTANLCANALGQYVFGALASTPPKELQQWFSSQREYYQTLMTKVAHEFKKELPKIIISKPQAALYSIVDVKQLVPPSFSAKDFSIFCAKEGKVTINDKEYTLLIAPLEGFYTTASGQKNPGTTQMRIAYVPEPEEIKLVPKLFKELLLQYLKRIS